MRRLCLVVGLGLWCALSLARAADQRNVTVFAAASLTNALQDAAKDFEAGGRAKVKFSFAASSLIARQIEAGAEADIFFSADTEWMDYLARRKLIATASRRDLLSNRLVLIAPRDSTVALKIAPGFALAQALGDSKLAVADPDTVPAGRYAKAALVSIGVWDVVVPKLVRAESVRAALAYVARGEAAFGIVYETDARAEAKVKMVDAFPGDMHPPIVYPVALTARAESREARAFLDYIIGPKAAGVFARYGFIVIAAPK